MEKNTGKNEKFPKMMLLKTATKNNDDLEQRANFDQKGHLSI